MQWGKRTLKFWNDERGATAIEYALIAVCIFLAIFGAVVFLGGSVAGHYNNVASSASSVM